MIEINDLPDEILEFILSYLPPYKDLKSCEKVCSRWSCAVKNVLYRGKLNFFKGLNEYNLSWTSNASNSIIPSGRFSHACCVHEDSMYIFGGGSSSDTTFNDLWRFDLSKREWIRPITMGSYPSPKGSATMIAYENKLILFGGWRYPSFHPPHQPWYLFDELHCYDIFENRWIAYNTVTTPPLMAGHSASLHGDKMVIFGGYQSDQNGQNTSSNEVWALNLKTFQWYKPIISNSLHTKPPPRYGQIQIAIDEYHLMIMGGSGGFNSLFSDCWILNMKEETWQWSVIPVKNRKWAATHMWNSPACRIGNKLVVCGPTPSVPADLQILKQKTNPNPFNAGIQRNNLNERNQLNNLERNHNRLRNNIIQADNNQRVDQRQNQNLRNVNMIDDQQRNLNDRIAHRNNIIQNNILNDNLVRNKLNDDSNNNSRNDASGSNNIQSSSNVNAASLGVMSSNSYNKAIKIVEPQNDNDAISRLQRNLALRSRDNDMKFPSRFNDQIQDGRICMAAFNVQQNNSIQIQKEHRQQERIRRLNEKLNQFKNAKKKLDERAVAPEANSSNERKLNDEHKNQEVVAQQNRPFNGNNNLQHPKQSLEEPKPKRTKINVLGMFVCDISNILNSTQPYLEWIEYKNSGILSGAPERLVFASMIPGKNELILFGGVQKESLCSKQHKVSNVVHFLSVPKEII